jgi:hypothetical protein
LVGRGNISSLFQRLPAAQPASADPVIDEDAARAVETWPLISLLSQSLLVPRRLEPTRLEREHEIDPAHPQPGSALDQMFSRLERMTRQAATEPEAPRPAEPVRYVEPAHHVEPVHYIEPARHIEPPMAQQPAAPSQVAPAPPRRTGVETSPARLFERF